MAPNVKKFFKLIVGRGLVSTKDAERLYRDWRNNAPDQRENFKSYAGYLVKKGVVSATQLEEALTGQSKDAEFDVELVPVEEPQWQFSRRDGLMIGAGAVATSMIWLAGTLAFRPKQPPPSE